MSMNALRPKIHPAVLDRRNNDGRCRTQMVARLPIPGRPWYVRKSESPGGRPARVLRRSLPGEKRCATPDMTWHAPLRMERPTKRHHKSCSPPNTAVTSRRRRSGDGSKSWVVIKACICRTKAGRGTNSVKCMAPFAPGELASTTQNAVGKWNEEQASSDNDKEVLRGVSIVKAQISLQRKTRFSEGGNAKVVSQVVSHVPS